ncbi:MAG: hypothetical protein KGP13_13290 [Burkholderiales bacterium]|nr:hypothetical protein [Burkholderiales bacterium]
MLETLNQSQNSNVLTAWLRQVVDYAAKCSLVSISFFAITHSASAADLDEKALAIAEQVHTGRIACEMGNVVHISPDADNRGVFMLQMGKHRFRMSPVPSATGAIRLEDPKAGAMWLQLANKSMLMNSKLGQRMADECQSPAQVAVSEVMKKGPVFNLLDGPVPSVAKK